MSAIDVLEGAGYACFVPLERKSCFDIAAKKEDRLVLVKTLSNIDSLRQQQCDDLKTMAESLGAAPIILGEKSKAYQLQDGVVYERYGVEVVTQNTLAQALQKHLPEKMFYKGRVVAQLDTQLLHKKMQDFSATKLADELRVTRASIYEYEKGMKIDFEKAKKMEEVLDADLIRDVDLFKVPAPAKHEVSGYLKKMMEIGFEVTPVHRGFDAIAKEKESLLVDKATPEGAKRKAVFMRKVGSFFGSHPIFVLTTKDHSVKGVPAVSEKELRSAETAGEVIDLVKKREK